MLNDDISLNSLIGFGSSITGDFKVNGFVRIDGDLIGNLETTGNVIIGENARIEGNIIARSVSVIGGIIKGNIIAPDSVKLTSTTVVLGDIQTHYLQSDDKVIIHGHCISLVSEAEFQKAVSDWENTVSFAKKSFMV